MQQQDYDSFDSLMQGIAENYGQTLTPEGIALRFKMLSSFPLEDVQKATASILCSRKYTTMPTVADFMEYLGGGSIEDQAEVEAGKVLAAIGRHGGNSTVVFDDPTTMAAIMNAYGGWPKLCEDCGVEESQKWFRHHFAKTWAAYKRQGIQVFGTLPGRHEISNTANGFTQFIEPPRLIGDEEKAKQVLSAGLFELPRQIEGGPVSFGVAMQRTLSVREAEGDVQ